MLKTEINIWNNLKFEFYFLFCFITKNYISILSRTEFLQHRAFRKRGQIFISKHEIVEESFSI